MRHQHKVCLFFFVCSFCWFSKCRPPRHHQVDDPNTVFVHVALGFHVEFTLPEAMSFSDVKRNSLGSALAKVATREAEIAQDLVSAESMVQELRALAESDR